MVILKHPAAVCNGIATDMFAARRDVDRGVRARQGDQQRRRVEEEEEVEEEDEDEAAVEAASRGGGGSRGAR